jgi:hypothetical protein
MALSLTTSSLHAQKYEPIPLTGKGEKLKAKYTSMLEDLKKEVVKDIPAIDEKKKAEFLKLREEWNALKNPGDDAGGEEVRLYKEATSRIESNSVIVARTIFPDIDSILSSDKHDQALMKIAMITDGTPQGLAEFAQQGDEEEALLDKLFSDPKLMKQVLYNGGANGGEYGEMMQVYTAILEKSERAREEGSIFQRLALGTALQMPWLPGKERGGVYGIAHADGDIAGSQVDRYLAYEKAYLDGELDPAFKDFNTWECRFITNDPYSDEELAWTREMLRNYRPDHITNPDYKWRYAMMVKSDVPYASPDWRPDEGTTTVQQIVAGGGKCGPRAFFGRTVCRAFGIPSRRSTQSGHAAMNHWTPDGWVVNFGGWWSINWAGPWGGLDFLLESQAREFENDFMKVVRAQWIADALGEEDVSIRQYGKGGGLWNQLAFNNKLAVVADAKAKALGEELAKLTADEARLLGESDEILDTLENQMIDIPEEHRSIVVKDDGVIFVPVAACTSPTNNTDRVLFMEDLKGNILMHYTRLGKNPELLRYTIDAPKDGKYNMVAHVSTVGREQEFMLRLNRRTIINFDLPFSLGFWQDTKPVEIELKEGRNTFMFTCAAPNRGVSIKHFTLTPVE